MENINIPSIRRYIIFNKRVLLVKNRLINTGTANVAITKNFFLPIKSDIVPPVRAPSAPVNSRTDRDEPATKSLKPIVFM